MVGFICPPIGGRCEGVVAQWVKKRWGGRERMGFLKRWKLNEAIECGTDGEWLQTQGNYFLAGGMEGARAPSLTGCSLQMDRGMDTHTQAHTSPHTRNRTPALRQLCMHSQLLNQPQIFFFNLTSSLECPLSVAGMKNMKNIISLLP